MLASPVPAAAERRAPPHIAAVVPGPELESAVLLGRSGQIYEPNGEGGWRRRERGGVGCAVQAALRLSGELWAVCSRAPLFHHSGGAWSAAPLANRGPSRATGGLAVVSIGRHIYVWKGSGWVRDSSAPGLIVALHAETPTRMVAITVRGALLRRSGSSWRTVLAAPRRDEGDPPAQLLGSDRHTYAISRAGVLSLVGARGLAPVKLPDGVASLRVEASGSGAGGAVIVAGAALGGAEPRPVLATLTGSRLELGDAPPLPAGDGASAVHAQGGKLLVATRAGRVYVRDAAGAWSERPVSAAPPPGPTPRAASRPARVP